MCNFITRKIGVTNVIFFYIALKPGLKIFIAFDEDLKKKLNTAKTSQCIIISTLTRELLVH